MSLSDLGPSQISRHEFDHDDVLHLPHRIWGRRIALRPLLRSSRSFGLHASSVSERTPIRSMSVLQGVAGVGVPRFGRF